MPSWFVQSFFWKLCGRECCGLDTAGGFLFQDFESFSLKVGKSIKIAFFSKNSSIYSKSCSGHMESNFGNSARLLWPETQNILAHCPKVRKVLFLPDFHPLEFSTGRVECLNDEPWVFLQIRFSSEKPSKDINLYLSPNNVLPKSSSGYVDFVFDPPCWKLLPQIRNFFIQNQKRMSNLILFTKKHFCLKAFLWTNDMRC